MLVFTAGFDLKLHIRHWQISWICLFQWFNHNGVVITLLDSTKLT